jgi:hypothetical protein
MTKVCDLSDKHEFIESDTNITGEYLLASTVNTDDIHISWRAIAALPDDRDNRVFSNPNRWTDRTVERLYYVIGTERLSRIQFYYGIIIWVSLIRL